MLYYVTRISLCISNVCPATETRFRAIRADPTRLDLPVVTSHTEPRTDVHGGCAVSRNVVARDVYRQETWSRCRCCRLTALTFCDVVAGDRSRALFIQKRSLFCGLLRLGQHVRVLDSTYVLDSSYGDSWSGARVRAHSAAVHSEPGSRYGE